MVYFVNYDEIMSQIDATIRSLQNPSSPVSKDTSSDDIWFYSSDWSDIQGMDGISGFNQVFIPFFE